MNDENLIPLNKRDPEEVAEITSAGGKASVKARRERKQLREELQIILEDGDMQKRVCTALVERALNGDPRAFALIRDTIGEKPIERTEVFTASPLEGSLEERRRLFLERLRALGNDEQAQN